ncbi:MAG: WD40 repeat domain-containing protein [Chloroflexi bacterium]|nr:WD40 repeat domain-containing protein [Chloroflexota bacterium]
MYREGSPNRIPLLVLLFALCFVALVLLRESGVLNALAQANPANTPTAAQPTEDTAAALAEANARAARYASMAHALLAERLAADNPFLAYTLAVDAARINNPPPQVHAALFTLTYNYRALRRIAAPNNVLNAAYNADGSQMMAVTVDGRVIVWDSASGEVVRTLRGPRNGASSAAFSADGARVYVGTWEGLIYVFDLVSGRTRRIAVNRPVESLAVSPDSNYLLFSYYEGLSLIDLNTFETVRQWTGHTSSVTDVLFSSDSRQALSASYDGTLVLWDINQDMPLRIFIGHEEVVTVAALNSDGTRLLSGDASGTVLLWDIGSGQVIARVKAHNQYVGALAFSPDGQQALTGSDERTVRLWQVTAQGLRLQATLAGHDSAINSAAFSADGRRALSSDVNGGVLLWDVARTDNPGVFASLYMPSSVAYAPDGRLAVTGSWENMLTLWDVRSGAALTSWMGHSGQITSVAFTPDGTSIVSASFDGTAAVWDAQTQQERLRINVGGAIARAVLSSDGARLLTGTLSGEVQLWDIASGELVRAFGEPSEFLAISSVALSRDGQYVLSGSNDGRLWLWDMAADNPLWEVSGLPGALKHLDFAPDGRSALVAADRGLLLLNREDGAVLRQFEGYRSAPEVAIFSPDGHYALSGGLDFDTILWDVATGNILHRFRSEYSATYGLDFSPDGRRALSVRDDLTLRVWEIPSLAELVNILTTERVLPLPTCAQRIQYLIEPLCDENGSVPAAAAFPTLTPTPVVSTPTPRPTSTPSATPASTQRATVGENRGEIAIGGGDVWTYEGSYGETLRIQVIAENPANTAEDRTGLFDPLLIIYLPSGRLLLEADDIQGGVLTDVRVEALALPVSGSYRFEVRSWDNQTGGAYTLVIESTPFVPTPTPTPTPTPEAMGRRDILGARSG